jgi:hypothetical protein
LWDVHLHNVFQTSQGEDRRQKSSLVKDGIREIKENLDLGLLGKTCHPERSPENEGD